MHEKVDNLHIHIKFTNSRSFMIIFNYFQLSQTPKLFPQAITNLDKGQFLKLPL